MRNVLIFGATGYIGAYLTDYLHRSLPEDYHVIAIGRRDTAFFKNNGIEYIQVDIKKDDDFKKLPEKAYAIVNLTGLLPAYSTNTVFDYVETNIKGSLRVMEYARSVKADRVLYTQTWSDLAGYWGEKEVLSPDLPRKLSYTSDHSFYAITKCMIVDTMEMYKQQFGVKNFVFRLPNVYMYAPEKTYYVDGVEKKIAYRYMIDRVSQGSDLELWGNPDAFKDILYIKDLCQMMFLAIKADVNGGTYNAGTGVKTSLREQLEGFVEVFAPPGSHPRIIEHPEKASIVSFVMDIENAEKDLGYHPQFSYIEYLKDYQREQELKRFDELWLKRN